MTALLGVIAFLELLAVLWLVAQSRRVRAREDERARLWNTALEALTARNDNRAYALADEWNALERGDENGPAAGEKLRATIQALRLYHEELERGRRDVEDVLSSLQDAVLVVDDEAHLRYINAAALSLFNVRIEDVLGAALLRAGFGGARRVARRQQHHA
jgi:PAS domain-containing protein